MGLNRDQRKQLAKNNAEARYKVLLNSLTIEAQFTSTSGRWRGILGSHLKGGLPCFDVLLVRAVDRYIEQREWSVKEAEDTEGYEASKTRAYILARTFYEETKAKLQTPATEEEGVPDASHLTTIEPTSIN